MFKFTFIIFKFENLNFGHSVAIFSPRVAIANLLKSNLRPSSENNILRLFSFLRPTTYGRRFDISQFKTQKGRIKRPFCFNGGAKEDRTPDLLNAIQALSQLSYNPD